MAAWGANSRYDRGYYLYDRAWEKGTMFLEIVLNGERLAREPP